MDYKYFLSIFFKNTFELVRFICNKQPDNIKMARVFFDEIKIELFSNFYNLLI